MTDIHSIQQALRAAGLDAWLLYDFRASNSIAWQILGLAPGTHCTRRWMVVVPAEGPAYKIVHQIEAHTLATVDIAEIRYAGRQEWSAAIGKLATQYKKVAMEYSPNNDLPVVSKVDAGTIEWLRSLGMEIVSSGDIAQQFTAVWTAEQYAENRLTAVNVREAMMRAFRFTRSALLEGRTISEYDVQQHILADFRSFDFVTDHAPIVAVNANAANPHYNPTETLHSPIQPGDLLLVDMWAKANTPGAVYSDITWMAYAGQSVPEEHAGIFGIIAEARDAVVRHLQGTIPRGKTVCAYELDDIARSIISQAGYGAQFFHRTGHSIAQETHGPGANLDNHETRDTRRIIPGTSFSVEPGIYLGGKAGYRTEIDVYITQDCAVEVTGGPAQEAILPLLADELKI